MRALIAYLALAPAVLYAETYSIDTKVSEVTVYPEGAEIIRAGRFDLPAGHHRLVLQGIPATDFDTQLATMRVDAQGLSQTAVIMRAEDVPWHDYQSDEVRAAEDRIADIEQRILAVQDQAQSARLRALAADHKISFLANLGKNEGLAASDAENLRAIAQMVGAETLEAEETAQQAEIAGRQIEEQLETLENELEAANADLRALTPETDERMFVAVEVVADADIKGDVTVSYLDFDSAEWMPGYAFNLTTGESPEVTIDRHIMVGQDTGENWQNITLNVSTLQPIGENAATEVRPKRQSISVPDPKDLEKPVAEAPVVFEMTERWAPDASAVEGTGLTFTLSEPVSISSGYEIAEFDLDSATGPADIFAAAAPLHDDVAYRTARFKNPFDQNLMSSVSAQWLVDGVLVAAGASPEMGPRADVEMGFGPLYGLTAERIIRKRSTGDTGLISRSNQSQEQVQIVVSNLTRKTWPLRIVDRVPYSEQDDLEVDWSADPRPDVEDADNRRGVLAWDIELEPGESETIEIRTTLNWPEEMVLD